MYGRGLVPRFSEYILKKKQTELWCENVQNIYEINLVVSDLQSRLNFYSSHLGEML